MDMVIIVQSMVIHISLNFFKVFFFLNLFFNLNRYGLLYRLQTLIKKKITILTFLINFFQNLFKKTLNKHKCCLFSFVFLSSLINFIT